MNVDLNICYQCDHLIMNEYDSECLLDGCHIRNGCAVPETCPSKALHVLEEERNSCGNCPVFYTCQRKSKCQTK